MEQALNAHTGKQRAHIVLLGLLGYVWGKMKWSPIEWYGRDMLFFLLARDSYVSDES